MDFEFSCLEFRPINLFRNFAFVEFLESLLVEIGLHFFDFLFDKPTLVNNDSMRFL